MSRKIATLMSWIFAFLMLTKELKAAAVDDKEKEQENLLTGLSVISEYIPIAQDKPRNETVTSCPDLWTETKNPLTAKEETGFLGSFNQLQELCPEKSKNLSLVCNAAIWISNYVCTASQGEKRQLPVIQDLKLLTKVGDLCNALFGDANLTQKVCGIVEVRVLNTNTFNSLPLIKEKLKKSCSLPQLGTNNCEQYCGGKNLHLCQIILQSLRTIVSWEEKKETMLKETVAIAETELPPSVTNEAASNLPSSTDSIKKSVVQQNTTQKGNSSLQVKDTSLNATTQSATIPTTITSDTAKAVLSLNTSSVVEQKTTKSPSTISTDIDSSVNTDTTVTDEDFGLDDNFGSADKPPIKTADEDPQSYEVGDEVDKEEKSTDKQAERIPVEMQKTVPSYGVSSEIDGDPINTHFLFYFIAFVVLSACGYLMFMRRKYLIALVLEGRTNSSRRRSNSFRERPSSGNYRKLVNNLEEAITSNAVKNSNVIY